MSTRRHLAFAATAIAVALLASAPPSAGRAAGPADGGAEAPPVDAEPSDAATQPDEIIHSWSLRPTGSPDPTEAGNRSSLSYTADPGSVIEDALTLANHGTVQLTFRIYATDAFNNADGEFDLLPGSESPVDVGTWVALPQEHVTIAPGREVTIPITLTVPADATPGDHIGAVLASNAAVGPTRDGRSVTFDRRTGPRLYLRVNGPLRPGLAVDRVETTYEPALSPLGGSAYVTYRIQNRGNISLGGVVRVSISGPFGIGKHELPPEDLVELLPGQSVDLAADFDGVPAMFVATAKVEVEPSSGEAVQPITASRQASAFAPPVAVLLILVALTFALVARRRYARHRRNVTEGLDGGGTEAESLVDHEREPQPT